MSLVAEAQSGERGGRGPFMSLECSAFELGCTEKVWGEGALMSQQCSPFELGCSGNNQGEDGVRLRKLVWGYLAPGYIARDSWLYSQWLYSQRLLAI